MLCYDKWNKRKYGEIMKEQFVRTSKIIGEEGLELLANKTVAVFGVGGVGGVKLNCVNYFGEIVFELHEFAWSYSSEHHMFALVKSLLLTFLVG